MILYHVTTSKKARRYRESGRITPPVRGFNTPMAAMAWAMKTGRTVIYEITTNDSVTYKLPDHHNRFGSAWWCDEDVLDFKCYYSAGVNS